MTPPNRCHVYLYQKDRKKGFALFSSMSTGIPDASVFDPSSRTRPDVNLPINAFAMQKNLAIRAKRRDSLTPLACDSKISRQEAEIREMVGRVKDS